MSRNQDVSTQRQLSHLNSQMAQLHANLSDFNELVQITSHQYKCVENLGKVHASIFMASQKVFEEEMFNDEGKIERN